MHYVCIKYLSDGDLLDLQDEKIRCPMSGKPIKMKDLLDIKFTLIKDGDSKKSLITKDVSLP